MIDLVNELNAAHRQVRRTEEEVGIVLRRTYPATAEDVWDALTDPERLARWFLPVTGDLKAGGTFQFEGNAGGEILHCEPSRLLRVTWGDASSIVELRLAAEGDGTALELDHTVPLAFAGSGAGALFPGPGWDISVMALGRYLGDEALPSDWESTREAQEFGRDSADAWAAAVRTSGTATEEEIAAGMAMALAQFAPDLADKS